MTQSEDGYVLVRGSTLAWLLERYREGDKRAPIPDEVARDLREAVLDGKVAPPPSGERIRASGPILGPEEHLALVMRELELPPSQRDFVLTIVKTAHMMMTTEAEAVLQLIAENKKT